MIARQSGGSAGLRGAALLEGAIARAEQRWAYGETSSLFDQAAALGVGLAKNHPFIDGNKRIAFVCVVTFLETNGVRFGADEADAAVTILGVATGTLTEVALSDWLRRNSTRPRPRR